ncbi:hypothetical protein BS78_04G130500 [Paspalum vaginatum]|nr:hypothetical protein BS78_04G130500 [Paspalum vaginatum]KAJ1279110.1 hypothetical protein BS78_04G130500 [Paspalum vaginatum]
MAAQAEGVGGAQSQWRRASCSPEARPRGAEGQPPGWRAHCSPEPEPGAQVSHCSRDAATERRRTAGGREEPCPSPTTPALTLCLLSVSAPPPRPAQGGRPSCCWTAHSPRA